MEKILVGGDSFTDPNFRSMKYPDYKHSFTWTDALNGNVTNVAKCGDGNPAIISRVLHEIYTNKPDRVIIALSCWTRFQVFNYSINPIMIYNMTCNDGEKNYPNIRADYDRMLKVIEPYLSTLSGHPIWPEMPLEDQLAEFMQKYLKHFIDSTVLELTNLAIICEHMGIKLHVFQMLYPLQGIKKVTKLFENALIKSDLFLDLSSRNIDLIGYPWIVDAGGIVVNDFLTSIDSESDKLRVGIEDMHPNAAGHRKIGEWFNENYSDYKI